MWTNQKMSPHLNYLHAYHSSIIHQNSLLITSFIIYDSSLIMYRSWFIIDYSSHGSLKQKNLQIHSVPDLQNGRSGNQDNTTKRTTMETKWTVKQLRIHFTNEKFACSPTRITWFKSVAILLINQRNAIVSNQPKQTTPNSAWLRRP